ncbi:MAG: AAA family ATPase [Spirulina sp. SIO3F2]|nr:AAA family ATPase [Spirulina sp. SIO3F2]
MINEIRVKNFKSYREGVLPLAPLTVLIGANASGKSNIIEAIKLLRDLAQGHPLNLLSQSRPQPFHPFLNANTDSNHSPPFRGHLEQLGYQGANSFQIACQLDSDLTDIWNQLEVTLTVKGANEAYIHQERIFDRKSGSSLYELSGEPQGLNGDVIVEYHPLPVNGRTAQTVCSNRMLIATQLLSEIRFPAADPESRQHIPQITNAFVEALSKIIFLAPEPNAMRSPSPVDATLSAAQTLARNGSNLSGVLYNLCQNQHDRQHLLDFIEDLPEQQITAIGFEQKVMGIRFKLTETFGDVEQTYDAETLSDGTLRVLAIAAVLLSAPSQSLIVIEEIDNGIHPSRVKDLLEKINTIAKKRQLRILTTSHNPALLDALPNETVPDVVFCYRNPEDGSSKLVRFQDIPDYVELMIQGSVGHLMTQGILDRFVKYHPGPEEKKRLALEWFENLQAEVEKIG